jgi:hypothetical protein
MKRYQKQASGKIARILILLSKIMLQKVIITEISVYYPKYALA